jgi:hypothetical protein
VDRILKVCGSGEHRLKVRANIRFVDLCLAAAFNAVKENVSLPWKTGAKKPDIGKGKGPADSKPDMALESPSKSKSPPGSTCIISNRHFARALTEIAPSSSETQSSLTEIHSWNTKFGSGGNKNIGGQGTGYLAQRTGVPGYNSTSAGGVPVYNPTGAGAGVPGYHPTGAGMGGVPSYNPTRVGGTVPGYDAAAVQNHISSYNPSGAGNGGVPSYSGYNHAGSGSGISGYDPRSTDFGIGGPRYGAGAGAGAGFGGMGGIGSTNSTFGAGSGSGALVGERDPGKSVDLGGISEIGAGYGKFGLGSGSGGLIGDRDLGNSAEL